MTQTIEVLQAEREEAVLRAVALEKQIEAEKAAVRNATLADLKAEIKLHGFGPGDLFTAAELGKPKKRGQTVRAPKYRNPATGATWVGLGKRPRWLQMALNAGDLLSEYAIAP